jgi:hypothetical protein
MKIGFIGLGNVGGKLAGSLLPGNISIYAAANARYLTAFFPFWPSWVAASRIPAQ